MRYAPPHRHIRKILRLAELGDPVDRVDGAAGAFALRAERVDAGQPHAEEDGIKVLAEVG